MRQQAYISLVRPHLEYSCAVWNSYIKKDIFRVEMVQRRAALFVQGAVNKFVKQGIN